VIVRPFESFDFGPVGLRVDLSAVPDGIRDMCASYPTMTGLFSFSASSKAVSDATKGSGVQSSTSSSISFLDSQPTITEGAAGLLRTSSESGT